MAEKPTAAFVLSLIGGIFLLLGGILATIGFTFLFGGFGAIFGIVGIVFALLVLVGGIMMYQKPESHTMWGVIVLVISIIAFPALWGFGIGSLLGFIGGILGIVFKPAPAMGVPMGVQPGQAMPAAAAHCTQCGAPLAPGAMRCSSCGAPVR